MQDDKLIRMATQIASFFRPYPEAEAVAGIAKHIRSFWTPAMRRAIRDRIEANPEGIEPLVVRAVRDEGAGNSLIRTPIKTETKGPDRLGQLASDAG